MEHLLRLYQLMVEGRKVTWGGKYSPAVIEALESETRLLTDGLERVLADLSAQTSSAVEISAVVDPKNFYKNQAFEQYVLAEEKLSGLLEIDMGIMDIIRRGTMIVRANSNPKDTYEKRRKNDGKYHHTMSIKELKIAVLKDWYANNQATIYNIVNECLLDVKKHLCKWNGEPSVSSLEAVQIQEQCEHILQNWPESICGGIEDVGLPVLEFIKDELDLRIGELKKKGFLKKSVGNSVLIPVEFLKPPIDDMIL